MENATQYRVLYSVVVTFVGWQKKVSKPIFNGLANCMDLSPFLPTGAILYT